MSYGNGGGGTLTLPSPNGVHHVDVSAAVRSLRRSLSRSPSKLNIARAYSQNSETTLSTPGSPSPCRNIQRPMPPASAPQLSHQLSQANLSTPYRSAVKLSLRSVKPKAASAKPLSRARVSPRSPIKRALSHTNDWGNSAIASSPSPPAARTLFDQENQVFDGLSLPLSPDSRKQSEQPEARHSMHLDMSGASNTFPRIFDFKADTIPSTSISPLKRSDVFMDPNKTSAGSPVAKRRSLHGVSVTPTGDTGSIFDATSSPTPKNFDIHEDLSKDYDLDPDSPSHQNEPTSPTPMPMPRRNDSLRRSTLHQRQNDKLSWNRRQGEKTLAQLGTEVASPMPMTRNLGRPRVSLDQFVQPALPRDSPFSAQAPLPNPSLHLMDKPHLQAQRHPLSRSVTTSSSNSSIADESPTHIPVVFDKPRAHPFARSMPIGARPLYENNNSAATPAYKNAKPFQDAFKSTGLISKVNRNPELEQPNFRESKMPDTPCKKPFYPSNTYPPSSGGGKGRQRHSFGSPSSPFAPDRRDSFSFGQPEKTSSLFKSFQPSQPTAGRKISMYSDVDTQNLDDNDDLPPTPTRSVFFKSIGNSKTVGSSPFVKTTTPATIPSFNFRDARQIPDPMCKSVSFSTSSGSDMSKQTPAETDQPRGALGANVSLHMPKSLSFAQRRARHGHNMTPRPLKLHSTFPILSNETKIEDTKIGVVSTASPSGPLDKVVATNSPRTPCDNSGFMPPDPSSLSISGYRTPNGGPLGGSFPPATPTSRIEQIGGFADRRMSITPVNGGGPGDVDMALNSRFEQVELIGKGEFSQVFKVTHVPQAAAIDLDRTPGTPPSPAESRVYAVKKIRVHFFSAKDREAKQREVQILQRLRESPHVLQYVDSWEKQYHLYIQTEYCEEGSLSVFLGNVGSAGRLDDFRIWKILIEITMGLQSIHDAGIIHLDLKPANILVTYEGQLKIGDFGLATKWPAANGIEGEGDRRYIASEILNGQYDKPADVFSLGLIMFEIASNVWLPDNGPHWLALRQGDFSAVPTGPLTGREADALQRDATGMPVPGDSDGAPAIPSLHATSVQPITNKSQDFPFDLMHSPTHNASNLFGASKRSDLRHPPSFMVEAQNEHSLDQLVQWMLSPDPAKRPKVQELLDFASVRWVTSHRRAGATVFEGNWGPQDDGEVDTEMADA